MQAQGGLWETLLGAVPGVGHVLRFFGEWDWYGVLLELIVLLPFL